MRQHIVDSNQRHLLRLEGQTNLGGHERFASAEKVAQHHGMGVIKVIGSGHVRVRVNPEHTHFAPIPLVEIGKWRLTDEAVPAEGDDALRGVSINNTPGCPHLTQDFLTVKNAAFFGRVASCPFFHRHLDQRGLTCRSQPSQQPRAQGIYLSGKLRFIIAALPLGVQQAQCFPHVLLIHDCSLPGTRFSSGSGIAGARPESPLLLGTQCLEPSGLSRLSSAGARHCNPGFS